jgi:hypothetical protein
MTSHGDTSGPPERYLSPAAVAGRFLARIETVRRWIDEGRLRTERDAEGGLRVPESALREFQQQAYRRERFNGVDHGLHSRPIDQPESSALPVPAQNAAEAEALAPRWPFPHA